MRRHTLQPVAPLAEMPGLDNHLCFALYAAGNHMTRIFVPFLKKRYPKKVCAYHGIDLSKGQAI